MDAELRSKLGGLALLIETRARDHAIAEVGRVLAGVEKFLRDYQLDEAVGEAYGHANGQSAHFQLTAGRALSSLRVTLIKARTNHYEKLFAEALVNTALKPENLKDLL